ncbi:MurR/RpiR family transcriptional regulator [Thermoanaerobacterium thermosaccharolyticum]|jgi:DNA-binding MurR/RpiR family transcriptional regulator|uniref:Transcriptional regulator, RpiR family n=2 Tax=Thermoanaerobacterium thermosaccharolyticum TaxID=1517 RepID=D9TTA4_THETC|nr:MurR/RpiR family transcriptional regulator [Thermoanaerobacterium thermosaccharolyticum]TCW37208.1 RpiR family transcriptional regulator [Thermohydrogenium kirishiense]ADL68870.1 transcriptional regulator, RpiR family [Thermoanaerobacterium thermosaccharolyticum DSM 571]AST59089.1 RpiR family transcriptional family [Thermoanaerobacterium thermosaccharolyticum]KAA5807680.1 MurR/RpiR family transcriptional regulator [Thermoanaerobacterium thermosaccharolyticum]MBE0068114.1 MurR/RpiR family tr
MDKNEDIIKRIQNNYTQLSKSQKIIAEYIINHYDKAAFMTAAKLGNSINISESTVVRFANTLGYDGYPELQSALQELIKNKLTTVQRLEMTDETDEVSILNNVLKSDIENIKETKEEIDKNSFKEVVDNIFKAKKIYIIGFRSSTAIAEYLGFYLNLILENVILVKPGISDVFEQMLRVDSNDLVIGIGFPRYSKRTLEVLKYAKSQNAKIVAITDSLISPLTEIADEILLAKSNMASFVDSLVAPLSLINALIVSVGIREKDKITDTFEKLENIWNEYEIYLSKNA